MHTGKPRKLDDKWVVSVLKEDETTVGPGDAVEKITRAGRRTVGEVGEVLSTFTVQDGTVYLCTMVNEEDGGEVEPPADTGGYQRRAAAPAARKPGVENRMIDDEIVRIGKVIDQIARKLDIEPVQAKTVGEKIVESDDDLPFTFVPFIPAGLAAAQALGLA